MFFSSKHLVFFPVGFLLYINLKINKSHHLFEFYSGFHRPPDVFQSLSNGYEKQNKKKQKQDKTKQKKTNKKKQILTSPDFKGSRLRFIILLILAIINIGF